jgi:uncharacterized metal-binding protein
MLLKKILPTKLGPPPMLSEREYSRQKVWLGCYVLVWIVVLIFLYIEWFELPLIVKIVLGVGEFVFTPDIDTVKRIFRSYGRYEQTYRET